MAYPSIHDLAWYLLLQEAAINNKIELDDLLKEPNWCEIILNYIKASPTTLYNFLNNKVIDTSLIRPPLQPGEGLPDEDKFDTITNSPLIDGTFKGKSSGIVRQLLLYIFNNSSVNEFGIASPLMHKLERNMWYMFECDSEIWGAYVAWFNKDALTRRIIENPDGYFYMGSLKCIVQFNGAADWAAVCNYLIGRLTHIYQKMGTLNVDPGWANRYILSNIDIIPDDLLIMMGDTRQQLVDKYTLK